MTVGVAVQTLPSAQFLLALKDLQEVKTLARVLEATHLMSCVQVHCDVPWQHTPHSVYGYCSDCLGMVF